MSLTMQPVYSDDFLITADKNPNTRGAAHSSSGRSRERELLQACAEGRIHFLYHLSARSDARIRLAARCVKRWAKWIAWFSRDPGISPRPRWPIFSFLPRSMPRRKEPSRIFRGGQRFRRRSSDRAIAARSRNSCPAGGRAWLPLSGASAEEVFREIGQSVRLLPG